MVKKIKSLVYDNNKRDAFVVTQDDGTTFDFIPSKEGLYFYDFMNSVKRSKEIDASHVMMVEMVEDIKRNFSKRGIENADLA
jgi:hypothetical protein